MLLNTKDLMEFLHIGRDVAYALMRSKTFPSIRIGSRYYVSEEAVTKWLRKQEHKQVIL